MKIGDKIPINFELIRLVENGEKVVLDDGMEHTIDNRAENLWWAKPAGSLPHENKHWWRILCLDQIRTERLPDMPVLAKMVEDFWK